MRTTSLVLFFALGVVTLLGAKEFKNNQYGYFIDIPESWIIASGNDPSQISFSDPGSKAVLQLVSFSPDRFASVDEMAEFVRGRFGATGESSPFRYRGTRAVLADLTFSTGSFNARGYFLFIHGTPQTFGASFLVMCTVPVSHYTQFHDQILSAINSFAPDAQSRNAPGPISQFYYPFPPPNLQRKEVELPYGRLESAAPPPSPGGTNRSADGGGGSAGGLRGSVASRDGSSGAVDDTVETSNNDGKIVVPYQIDPEEAEVSQIFIEREARILSAYSPSSQARWGGNGEGWKSAWKRYYRTIFRDNYLRLASLAEGLEEAFSLQEVPRDEIPRIVLKWLQGFRYVRVPSLSDLSSPVTAVIERTGDCDSLALVYSILLDHMGFDTILLISNRYAHALGGVVTDGAGARLEFEEKSYLLAEMTEEVDMGLIPQDMADPAGWIPVRLRQSPIM